MLHENKTKILGLIEQLLARVPLEALTNVVIFGSAAITLNDKDLEREIDDLDLFASDATYAMLCTSPVTKEVEKKPGLWCLTVGVPNIEIWKTFPGVTHSEVKTRACTLDGSGQLLVASLEDLCAWKRAQPGEKHARDLKKMDC